MFVCRSCIGYLRASFARPVVSGRIVVGTTHRVIWRPCCCVLLMPSTGASVFLSGCQLCFQTCSSSICLTKITKSCRTHLHCLLFYFPDSYPYGHQENLRVWCYNSLQKCLPRCGFKGYATSLVLFFTFFICFDEDSPVCNICVRVAEPSLFLDFLGFSMSFCISPAEPVNQMFCFIDICFCLQR